ncbi:hypothetical protein GobsT_34980 [Gemmata obscuriglobus]|uniref:DUF58 domain-containing protein n=1 Tax=Gemmata obscuriglobus TaxID=114 RepID=A0A2Z3H207_9BACT|nr:DUF58 domain-containing protein [Gemmata obscuriglobus]AWM38372.1 DUF58 domain-containing protein [Gemmata obscuriglobus]QEG28712.1 hypothetical protein GobsT_34980 [Gemmata obscuriglobus]VTS06987.1 Conserved repeat protein OS=Singulisphaera acidiphila (strain ATCC BAA-1392 / DSM 18658 / VKM B-2454 / MOB10) GN=Sinac_2139 PE=4 SV=1: DUF58 [Gemmata obscuriglobus UQM 2246]
MKWFLAIALLIGAALALQAGLVAFAGYVLLGVYLLSRYLARRWVHDLEATRECDSSPREVGESTAVTVTLSNAGAIPIAWVLVEDLLPDFAVKARTPRITAKGKRVQVVTLGSRGTKTIRYKVTFQMRGYYPLGPTLLETGDVFGLHRRHRVIGKPVYVMVYPKVVALPKYNFASERPIGEVRLQNRLFEDPTRTAGVRQYVQGDPLQRVHWKVTARTGQLHCRIYEPTTLAGATILVDFHQDGYHKRGEPFRSELAITTAASLAYLVSVLNVQIGFASNGRDAADRIREDALAAESEEAQREGHTTREEARDRFELADGSDRVRPVVVDTRRGFDQYQQIREALARLELSDALTFGQLALEMAGRMPRDATVIALLPRVPAETAIALGTLKRQGFAVSAILIGLDENHKLEAHGRLLAETIRDIRYVSTEEELAHLCENKAANAPAAYSVDIPLG